MNSEWQRVMDAQTGDVMWEFHDEINDVHGYVIRGPGALCGYVGTRHAHALWKCTESVRNNYYDAFDWIPVHGGMTYMGSLEATGVYDPRYLYIGWDYAHAGDAVSFDSLKSYGHMRGHQWTVPEVAAHVLRVMHVFVNYKKLVEATEAGLCDEKSIELFKQLGQ